MTLILNGTDNSATTPAVTGTDTDTGVYYPTSNQVALATNGTNAVTVTSTQNVGIGTVGPNARVQIESTGNGLAVGANNFTPTASTMVQINSSGNSSSENILILASLNAGIRLTFPASGGIQFPATQAVSTNVNTLDDYEEGTWTPSAGSESGVLTATYGARTGKYVKIGRWVWCGFDCELTSRTNAGSLAFLYGLPFGVANNGDLSGGVGSVGINFNAGSNYYQIGMYPQNNAVYCYLTATTSNTSNLSAMAQAFWGATTRLCGGFYFLSDA